MMFASTNDVANANDVSFGNDDGFALCFDANIASLRNKVEQHHFERSEKHHIACGDASLNCGKRDRKIDILFFELTH